MRDVRSTTRWTAAAGLALAVFAVGACGGTSRSGTSPSRAKAHTLTVFAAASLTTAFGAYARDFTTARVHYSFGGSDQLAAQIEHGLKPDVFAAANTQLPERLFAKGLVSRPVRFAANRLVIAVPARAAKVRGIRDLERPGVAIAIGSPTVPIGSYTRAVLARLGPGTRTAILRNVRSQEPDVNGIVGKLTQGAVDAGFTYATDVRATKGALRAIPLPRSAQPVVAYAAAIVSGAAEVPAARAFLSGLLAGPGRHDLQAAGFLPPPAASSSTR
ncbi:MAG: molybdate ABC transporter substrate-binding protein [Actinobacteria bacterium]|nr:molybdate ABC transporter substrate-binding protein [Actinomycetota bacterium]